MNTPTNQYKPQIAFHPGETLAEKLEELGMGPKEFALRTRKPEKTVIAVLNAKSSITPEMAVKFENVLKIPAHFWLNKQRNYEEFLARIEREEILKESNDWARNFPYADMANKGWLPKTSRISEKTNALLNFFGFSDHLAWQKYYFGQQLKVAFRISLAHTKAPYAVSAWLRKGEIQAAELSVKAFSEKAFKDALPKIKKVMAKQPVNFFGQLQSICADAGVKVVHTPCVPKAPISGCTRWINNNPLIQLSGRYKRNDIFWFTFFHEVGHILLHGKKDIFLESIEYSDKDIQKENEADAFAKKWTLSETEEAEILEHFELSEQDILAFAKKFGTHPAIIIGRLQHKGLIRFDEGRVFIEVVELS